MNGVSVHGRSSSATYMPNCNSSTGTLFFIVGDDPRLRYRMLEDAEVLAQRCSAAYARLGPALLVAAVLSGLLSAALWSSRPHELILFWQALMLLIVVAAGARGGGHPPAAPAPPPPPPLGGRPAPAGPPP